MTGFVFCKRNGACSGNNMDSRLTFQCACPADFHIIYDVNRSRSQRLSQTIPHGLILPGIFAVARKPDANTCAIGKLCANFLQAAFHAIRNHFCRTVYAEHLIGAPSSQLCARLAARFRGCHDRSFRSAAVNADIPFFHVVPPFGIRVSCFFSHSV